MQINNIGFPMGLFGAGGAAPGAGIGFAQMLGAPADPSGAGTGMTPPLAANDSVAPAATMSMAQLLTTAAAPAVTVPAAQPVVTAPDAQPVLADPTIGEPAVPGEVPAAAVPQTPDKPIVKAKPNPSAKPAPDTKPVPGTGLDLRADPAPEAPVAEAAAEQPAEDGKTAPPMKRGPRLADEAIEEIPVPLDAQPVAADPALVMVAAAQAPVRPELAVKPQPSPTRQIGEVTTKAGKTDTMRAEPGTAQPAGTDKAHATVSAVAGKAGDKNDNASSDERGQAPAFTLRQDAHAAPAHAATEPARTQAVAAVTAAEPVVAARPGHLGQQMGVEIARKVEAGEDMLRVRLSPENLGKVEVTLSFDDGGTLRATVRAESQQALDMLRQDAPDLGRALDQAGIRADAQSFRFESRSDGGGAQAQQQQSQNPSGGQFAGNDESDTTEVAYREIRGDGQVDLLA